MVVLTAKDIINQAKFFSNTRNSPLTDFYINTYLLSSIYRDLYTEVVGNSNEGVSTIVTDDSVVDLRGVYKVLYVGYENGGEITRSSLRTNQTGGYFIENSTIYLPVGRKIIKYATLPDTITCPDDYKEVTVDRDFNPYINYGLTEEDEVTEDEPRNLWGEEIDSVKDWMIKEGVGVIRFNVSDPYCFVSYADGTVRLYSSKTYYTEWNPNIQKGKGFKGIVYAFTSNEETGKGVLYYDSIEKKYKVGSFVPNTVLSYPDNTLFTLMVYKLAAILGSLVGIENPYLTQTLLPEAETKFYQTISRGSATRTTNVWRGY